MQPKIEKSKAAILKALQECDGATGADRLVHKLDAMGISLQPRTVRYYLMQLDREGLTRFVGRRQGRELTPRGREELAHANVAEKLGFIAAKVDALGYQMSFDRHTGRGSIITNVALIDRHAIGVAMEAMRGVFNAGLGMGRLLRLATAGQRVGHVSVPEGMVGVGPVCSVTMNGILLKEAIPVTSRFGGLLEMRDGEPIRFVELIEYSGTTLDPLEAFIFAGMTRVRECVRTGTGLIGASFREIPAVAVQGVERLRRDLDRQGLGGILAVGKPSRPLFGVPVAEGRAGIIVIGGLNPVAAAYETGVRLSMLSLAGLEEFSTFMDYREIRVPGGA
jgi:hypothetical protein